MIVSDFTQAWETLFGVYSPIQIVNADNTISYMCDWGYIMRVVFFIVVVFCVLKIVGGALKNDKR